jgi:2-phospho-L-lactate transferase/gluconeogenesis factor (CofD/UPF0052 family)
VDGLGRHNSELTRRHSVGNYFLAATTMFFRSLPSAIFLFSSITKSQANILPVIVTNHTVTLAAELENSERIFGQCEISHPSRPTGPQPFRARRDTFDYTHHPASPSERANATFHADDKGSTPALPARISRVFYVDTLGQEIEPSPNRDYIASLRTYDVLVYSCGSLWTRFVEPSRGVAGS